MKEIYDKKYIVSVKYDDNDVFYHSTDGEEGVFVGIRSNAHKFDSEFDAIPLYALLKANGYDACIEQFYIV